MGWPGLSRLKHSKEQNSVYLEKICTAQYHNQITCKITHQLYYPEKMCIYKCCNMRMLNFQQKNSWMLQKFTLISKSLLISCKLPFPIVCLKYIPFFLTKCSQSQKWSNTCSSSSKQLFVYNFDLQLEHTHYRDYCTNNFKQNPVTIKLYLLNSGLDSVKYKDISVSAHLHYFHTKNAVIKQNSVILVQSNMRNTSFKYNVYQENTLMLISNGCENDKVQFVGNFSLT